MLLITSAEYISQEFASEVGLLPPSMLPIANKRLYQLQFDLLKDYKGDKFLSLPKSFMLNAFDERELQKLAVKVLWVPSNISLAESILYCWNSTGKFYKELKILHGDTLFSDINLSTKDCISVHKNDGFYPRATISLDTSIVGERLWASKDELVASGYFSFSQPATFIKNILDSNHNFESAVKTYTDKQKIEILTNGVWYDFGHLNSYFRSRAQMTTQRAFNQLHISKFSVEKYSDQHRKIEAESNWFCSIPSSIKSYTPNLINPTIYSSNNKRGYSLEYLYLLTLSDLYVFSKLTIAEWKFIFSTLNLMLRKFSKIKKTFTEYDKATAESLYLEKTLRRLNAFSGQQPSVIKERYYVAALGKKVSLEEIAKHTANFIGNVNEERLCFIHGDLCFSNIFFDFRSHNLKLIDPRGIDYKDKPSVYGDQRYDVAKLYQSFVGGYDFIIAGRYRISLSADEGPSIEIYSDLPLSEMRELFIKEVIAKFGYSEIEILAITIHLFISMLPLHYDSDEKQKGFVFNVYRLFNWFVQMEQELS